MVLLSHVWRCYVLGYGALSQLSLLGGFKQAAILSIEIEAKE